MRALAPALLGLSLACGALAFAPATAHAFSDTLTFGKVADEGGGGGRYFTGSPADGYTCKVCHLHGTAPTLNILGLPLSGWVPNKAYEITLDWPDQLEHVALAVEITDDVGIGIGTLRVPPMGELQDSEKCMGTPIGAGQVVPLINRTVVTMPDCGAHQLRFLWTAPDAERGTAHLSGSIVVTNADESSEGDGVLDFDRAMGSPRKPGMTSFKITGCSVSNGSENNGLAWLITLAMMSVVVVLRRRTRD
jgi:hypothetical protein